MQLVLLGDVAAEEKLTMLAHRDTAAVLEPEARSVLEMLCCGLVGAAPALATLVTSPGKAARGREGAPGGSAAGGGEAGGGGAPAANGTAAPAVLFQTSVTLPAAYFPPERFHVAGASMPLDVFVGPALPSEAAAANAASLLALCALHRLGIVVRYWPSRLLLAQHLLPRSVQPAAAGASDGTTTASLAPPEAAAAAYAAMQQLDGGLGAPGAATGAQASFFCPLCNVAATGHKVRAVLQARVGVRLSH